MDRATVDHALVQQHVQIHRSCTGACERAGQTQAAEPDPCIPTAHPLLQRVTTAVQETAQLNQEPGLVKGRKTALMSSAVVTAESLKDREYSIQEGWSKQALWDSKKQKVK